MKSAERTIELQRHRSILLCTIDYILEKIASENLPKANFENVSEYYLKQQYQIEKDFEMRRLSLLQQRLNKLIEFPTRKCDLTFCDYIKRETGYDIDIFENLQIRVEEIINKNQIKNKKEFSDVFIILDLYEQQSMQQGKVAKIKSLLFNYFERRKAKNSIKSPLFEVLAQRTSKKEINRIL